MQKIPLQKDKNGKVQEPVSTATDGKKLYARFQEKAYGTPAFILYYQFNGENLIYEKLEIIESNQ